MSYPPIEPVPSHMGHPHMTQQQIQQAIAAHQQQNPKRPVARHACLACREKKVKCDGEVPLSYGDKPDLRHQQCTNCKVAGIECVFVKSQRGGRRKKDSNGTLLSQTRDSITTSASTPTTTTSYGGSFSTATSDHHLSNTPTSPRGLHPITSSLDPPPSIAATSPFFHPGRASPSFGPGSDRGSSVSGGSLQEKVQQLQREAANLQSQLMDRNGSIVSSSASSDYFPPQDGHGPHGGPPSMRGPGGPPGSDYGPWDRHHRGPHHHHFGPHDRHRGPPPPWANSNGMPPPPGFGPGGPHGGPHHHRGPRHHHYGHHPMAMHPGSGPLPPPFPFSSFDDEQSRKRPHPGQDSDFSLPKLAPSMSYVVIPDSELERFDLPNWDVTCILLDLYYRYIHPSRPFLPPKHRLIYQLQVRQDASLIHAMFSSACRFASSMTIPNPNMRDPQHWYFLAEKYWDYMDAETALQALVLLMGSLGPHGYVQQSIEGSERIYQVMKTSHLLDARKVTDWNDFASVATKKQVLRHEDMLRTIWGSWKLNVFLRLNRGAPYHQISGKLLTFPHDLPLPSSDTQYNLNLGLFDSTDSSCLQRLRYHHWSDLERVSTSAHFSPPEYHNITDSDLIIMATKKVEEVMDAVSSGYLISSVVNQLNEKFKTIHDIASASLYNISHIKKKTAVLNISKLFALFMMDVAKLTSNASQCSQILFVKPHETQSNNNPDAVLNSLYKSKLEDIYSGCLNLTSSQISHFIECFMAGLNAVSLVELGLGKFPEASTSNAPITVVGGPLNFTASEEISSLKSNETWWTDAIPEQGKTMSAHVETYNEFPDVWLQYPVFSVVVIANTLTILASSVILTRQMAVRELPATPDLQPSQVRAEFVIGEGQHTVSVILDKTTLDDFKAAFNTIDLHEKIALCRRFVKAHGRFWPYVESTSHQIDAMINYIEDIMQRT